VSQTGADNGLAYSHDRHLILTSAVPALETHPDQLAVAWRYDGRPSARGRVGPILQRTETSVCHQCAVTADAQR